jgi:hypothetical protein
MAGIAVKSKVSRTLGRLLRCRKGTAEIIGSVMFLLIMMFFFTNVFLWHDNATREMDGVLAEKMNSPISVQVVSMNVTKPPGPDYRLKVTNNGGVGVDLSRLWINVDLDDLGGEDHVAYNFDYWLAAGEAKNFTIPTSWIERDFNEKSITTLTFTFKVVTTRGNMASCSIIPYN